MLKVKIDNEEKGFFNMFTHFMISLKGKCLIYGGKKMKKGYFRDGFLILVMFLTMFWSLFSVDGNIDFTDSLILVPMLFISSFYLITPIFLSAEKINSIDNWFNSFIGINQNNEE